MKVYRDIIDDDYLLVVKQYNHNSKNKNYYFLKEIKNYENYLKYLNYIFRIKKKLQYYEMLIHNYCIRKHIELYDKWNKIVYKKLNKSS
jgi:hypothetical protein